VPKQMESEGATSTSSFLAGALQEIAKCVGSAVSSWQMQLAIPNASADLQRQYYDAIVKRQLQQMMMEDTSCSSSNIPNQINVSSLDLQTTSSGTPSAKTMKNNNYNPIESNNADNYDDDDDLSEVPGTIPPPKFID
jgi:hypothetical protein